jgi:hypothetical protein
MINIILISTKYQIENEYGSLTVCDTNYTIALRDLFVDYLGKDVVYFTTGFFL